MSTILIVDDEISALEALKMIFKEDHQVLTAQTGQQALNILDNEFIDLVVLDITMPDINGMEVLRIIKEKTADVAVVMVTATKNLKTVVEAVKLGASDYVVKPFDVEEIRIIVEKTLKETRISRELSYLRQEIDRGYKFDELVGTSQIMRNVFENVLRVAPSKSTILVTGESGTGKELVARSIHRHSTRAKNPFIAVHCPNLPEALLESDLFGHHKGSFTNATEMKPGKFELAHTGTLFLDEISEMSPGVQAKILRVLEEQEFERVGGTRPIKVDVRVIAATNKDLKTAISQGVFREDLYYRINVVPVNLPPLRERREDIALLVEYFFQKFKEELNSKAKGISADALDLLTVYEWPGNVRELKNVIERALALHGEEEFILPSHLPGEINDGYKQEIPRSPFSLGSTSFQEAVANFEKRLIKAALAKTHGSQVKAAKILGTTRRILKYRMDKLGIKQEAFNSGAQSPSLKG
ncbi:MAG: Fis family transcriptional regulator [Planctomycetes bacterium DG_23]|nr:MAG: Fis family transcriptional regulator [Planctomycetes bacterium DG_23]